MWKISAHLSMAAFWPHQVTTELALTGSNSSPGLFFYFNMGLLSLDNLPCFWVDQFFLRQSDCLCQSDVHFSLLFSCIYCPTLSSWYAVGSFSGWGRAQCKRTLSWWVHALETSDEQSFYPVLGSVTFSLQPKMTVSEGVDLRPKLPFSASF